MGNPARVLVTISFVFLASACGEQDEQISPLDPPASLRVLFVGDDLLADYDFRAYFYELARSQPGSGEIVIGLSKRNVYRLPQHPESDGLEREIRTGNYGVVVVQGIGGWPDCAESARQCSYFESQLRQISDLAGQHGAETIWISMWYPEPGVDARYSERVEAIAERAGVRAVDAGRALHSSEEFDALSQLLSPTLRLRPMGSWYLAALLLAAIQDAPLSEPTATLSLCGPHLVVSDIGGTQGEIREIFTPREGVSEPITPQEGEFMSEVFTCDDSLSEDQAARIFRDVNAAMGFPQ